jgi:hypothetical protein
MARLLSFCTEGDSMRLKKIDVNAFISPCSLEDYMGEKRKNNHQT